VLGVCEQGLFTYALLMWGYTSWLTVTCAVGTRSSSCQSPMHPCECCLACVTSQTEVSVMFGSMWDYSWG
jgi:hypothetical protein